MARNRSVVAFGALSSLAFALLAGCSAATPQTSGPGAVTPAVSGSSSPTASTGGAAANGCTEWDGQEGVVRTFCTGPASATVTINGAETALTGGSCEMAGTLFAFNLGVVTSNFPEAKTKPNYVGLIHDISSKSTQAFVVTVSGDTELVLKAAATVAADQKSAQASGKSINGKTVAVKIRCA
jgi:hypothetical protein